MKYSYNWIQEHIEEKLPAPKELAEQIVFHAFEVEEIEEKGSDTVFEIKVLPDRAGDCLSHRGMAREVAGLLGLTFKEGESIPLPKVDGIVPVQLQSDLCRRYMAVRIDGVRVGPSPEWLAQKLQSVGQRSINNIVDATNFVLFDIGQPVHAFDAAKVDGGIVVRIAHEGETIKLLGGDEKVLKESDLVIADYLGALAIAGVKGGQSAEVTEATTSIIVEVANFDPTSVRKTSRRLGLITDASKRFENNFSQLFALPAMEQVVALILRIAGGEVVGATDEHTNEVVARKLTFSTSDIVRLLGSTITEKDIQEILDRYCYQYEHNDSVFTIGIPHYRADIMGTHDVAEEVGRSVGYERIPALPLPFGPTIIPNEIATEIAMVRAWATTQGFREVYTYTFRAKGEVNVAYGAKGKDALRSALSDGLKESYELNRLNAPLIGAKEIKLFEVGTVFFADREEVHVALCDKGTIQELPITEFIKEKAIAGAPDAFVEKIMNAPSPFVPWSQYPFITRDIALWVTNEARAAAEKAITAFSDAHCATPAHCFDEFTKEGRTSIAYRLVFQASDRTLTDADVAGVFGELQKQLATIDGAELR